MVTGVCDTSVGVGAGDDGALVGVGVGELVGEPTGQVGTSVAVKFGWVGEAGLDVAGEVTSVAGAVPEASGITLVGLGSAAVTTGSAVATHLAVDTECGVADCDFPEIGRAHV